MQTIKTPICHSDVRAVLRNIQNNDLYLHLGGDSYRNLRTGKEGVISPELAASILNINVPMTQMIGENNVIADFIQKMNLKIEPTNFNL